MINNSKRYIGARIPGTGDNGGLQFSDGGFIFTLADSCFAYACNSHNQSTLAAGARIDFLAPGRAGDVLLARAEERALAGRTGIYDVTVSNQDGKEIALFRGNSHRIKGELVPQGENA